MAAGRPRKRKIDPTPFAMALGARLKQLRERAGVGVYELADRAGVGPPRVYGWEHGEQTPGAENLARLAAALGVSLAEFDGLVVLRPVEEIISAKPEKKR